MIADLLMERSARFVHQHVTCWKLSPQHIEDCKRDVQVQMLQDLFNDSRGCEFWEVRFWLCLKRRLLNVVQKYQTPGRKPSSRPRPLKTTRGMPLITLTKWPRPMSCPLPERVEIREALRALPDQERKAFVLYHYEDWPQDANRGNVGRHRPDGSQSAGPRSKTPGSVA